MAFQTNNPPTVASPDGQFSQCAVVESGTRLLFISGQVPRNSSGETVGIGNMSAQAEQVFQNIHLILQSYNATFANTIKATIFVTDMQRADEVTNVRAKFYGDAAPASTFVGISALGNPDWLLEVELIAEVGA
jgi:2-iminobutanoate/2-iminopropanoate deaminase